MLLDVSENAKCCGIIQVIHWSTLLAYKLFGKFAGFVQHTGCSKEKWTKRIWWSKLLPERFSQSLWLKVHLKSIYIHLHGFIVSAHRKERFPSKRTKKYVLKNSPRWIHSKKKKKKNYDDFLVQKFQDVFLHTWTFVEMPELLPSTGTSSSSTLA